MRIIKDHVTFTFKQIALFVLSASLIQYASAGIPNTNSPSTFVGPFVHGAFTNGINGTSAFTLGADVGKNNYRLDGTIAWQDYGNQRFKLSAEWLSQNIEYSYFVADTTQWVNQSDVAFNYRYYFEDYYFDPQAGLDLYYLHSTTKSLRTNSGTYINSDGITTPYVNSKRIAGVNAWGAAPGVSMRLWQGGRVGVKLNYDNNNYDTVYVSNKNANGLGSTIEAIQALSNDVHVGAAIALVQAYNDYAANITFSNLPFYGNWALGINGNYTIGKNTMPDTYNIGFSADYMLDQSNITSTSAKAAKEDFLTWTARSAAYKPQVLGVPDQRVE